jgi:GPH family glycoside/pentoside/hexuronide:cation symporter
MANNVTTASDQKVSVGEICSVGFNYGGMMIQQIMVGSYISFFFTNYCGLPSTLVGLFVSIATVIDFFTDFIMGAIVDSKNFPDGKVKPWMKRTIIPMMLCMLCPFFIPFNGNGMGVMLWAGLMYCLGQAVFGTMRTIPMMMLPAVISQDVKERTKVESIGMMTLGMVFMIAASYTLFPLVNLFGGGKWGWFGAACVYAGICGVLSALTLHNIHERVQTEEKPMQVLVEIWKGLINCCRSKNYLIILLCMAFGNLSTSTAVVTYYAQYILQNPNATANMMLMLMVPTIIGYIFVPALVKVLGKKNTCMATWTLGIIAFIIMIAFQTNTAMFSLGMILNSLGITGYMGCKLSMTGDSLELYHLQTGKPLAEAVAYSAHAMVMKLAAAAKSAIVGVVLGVTGYISSVDGAVVEQPDSALFGIKALFLYIPLALMAICMVLFLFYDTDKKLPEARKAAGIQ